MEMETDGDENLVPHIPSMKLTEIQIKFKDISWCVHNWMCSQLNAM
jgi:hypothetical protein